MPFRPWTRVRFLSTVPWFIDKPHVQQSFIPKAAEICPIPDHAPQIIKLLHSQLLQSPHLDRSALSVGPAIPPSPAPPLPRLLPHGRRNRGGTFSGESVYDMPDGGLWSWVVVAQVSVFFEKQMACPYFPKGERRHGEKRCNRICRMRHSKNGGMIHFLHWIGLFAHSTRVQLLGHEPPFLLPPKSRRQAGTGWVMIDAGSFAVHILSKDAREKYFNNQTVP